MARARQLERRQDDLEVAPNRLNTSREANKEFFDRKRKKRQSKLKKEDIVLLYNSWLDKQWSKKLDNRWSGPYLVEEVKESRGTYLLKKLDDMLLDGVYPGERLKRFFPRRGVDPHEEEAEG